MQGEIFSVKEITDVAKKYGKTAAQIVLRWSIQNGVVTIPKSSRRQRIIDNTDIFGFELDEEEREGLKKLWDGRRIFPDPDNCYF